MASRQARIAENLRIRARMTSGIRSFFTSDGFLEVEVPCRVPVPLPEAHIDCEPSGGWFLHASPEACMKRLLCAGYEKIFTICRVFRQGERGHKHLPEFCMLEWYRAGAGYKKLMDDCQDLILFLAQELGHGQAVHYQGAHIDLCLPWPKLSVRDALEKLSGVALEKALAQDSFDYLMAFEVEPRLPRDRPVFLYDYPAEKTPLAKRAAHDPGLTERFELYIAGLELANAYSELNDPAEQRLRLNVEEAVRVAAGKDPYPPPERFLQDLASMPPAAGIALGLDRLAMLFANAADIQDVTAFTPEEL